MEAKLPMMMEGTYTPGFKIALHIKDLNNVLSTAHELGAPMPLTSQVQEMLHWLGNHGSSQEDHSAILKFYEKLSGVTISDFYRGLSDFPC